MSLLICDLNIYKKGHNISYMTYIIKNYRLYTNEKIYFLFNEEARDLLKDVLLSETDNVYFSNVNDSNFGGILGKLDRALKFKHWKEIRRIANLIGVVRLILMDIEQYQICVGLSRINFDFAGIYFRPHNWIKTNSVDIRVSTNVFISRLKKLLLEYILLQNKRVKKIFLLNDLKGPQYLNKYFSTSCFKHLPDPIFTTHAKQIDIRKTYNIKENSCIMLLFGAISPRKNINNIIKALEAFNNISLLVTLLIVGKMSHEYEEMIKVNCAKLSVYSQVVVVNSFVDDSDMENFFQQSDIILLAYKDFFCSSGLMGHAAKYNKPMVLPDTGLMNDINNQYNLGVACNVNNYKSIARSLLKIIDNKLLFNNNGAIFYEDHQPGSFLKVLLKV